MTHYVMHLRLNPPTRARLEGLAARGITIRRLLDLADRLDCSCPVPAGGREVGPDGVFAMLPCDEVRL